MNAYNSTVERSSVLIPKKLLRINTLDDFRENTPSPPYPPKSSPIKSFNKKIYFSPKPDHIMKLIETPKSGINNIPKRKEIMEKIIEDVVNNMMEQICPDKISKPKLNKLYNCISISDNDDIEDLELIEINTN